MKGKGTHMNKERIFTEQEYNALDYYLTESKLYDSGFCIQQDTEDYFQDFEDDTRYSIEDGLQIIYESMILDQIEQEYDKEIKDGLVAVFKRFKNIDLFGEDND